MSFEA